jgi:acyl-CoA dehydrogenase
VSILYDEGQQAIATQSRRVLEAKLERQQLLGLLDRTGAYDETFWEIAVEQGWTAVALPESCGGLGLGLLELGLVAQAAGAATAGAPFLLTNHGAARALLSSGNRTLMEHWLPKLACGEAVGALALAEGNVLVPQVPRTSIRDGQVCGTKHGVAAGLKADFAVVWAAHDGVPVLALVELDEVSRQAVDSFDNSRLFAALTFSSAPATVLARGDAARSLIRDMLGHVAVVAAHEHLGGAEALLLVARDYANTRWAFGQPIGAFQSVKHRIAELYGLVEIARANCIHAASREGHAEFLKAAAAARLSSTEAYDTAVRDCIQIHGGIGVTWESGLHLHMRRARSLAIEAGSALFWEDLLVDELAGADV